MIFVPSYCPGPRSISFGAVSEFLIVQNPGATRRVDSSGGKLIKRGYLNVDQAVYHPLLAFFRTCYQVNVILGDCLEENGVESLEFLFSIRNTL